MIFNVGPLLSSNGSFWTHWVRWIGADIPRQTGRRRRGSLSLRWRSPLSIPWSNRRIGFSWAPARMRHSRQQMSWIVLFFNMWILLFCRIISVECALNVIFQCTPLDRVKAKVLGEIAYLNAPLNGCRLLQVCSLPDFLNKCTFNLERGVKGCIMYKRKSLRIL